MKIAIIAPSPVPFGIGGAENLWWGLLNEINQNTSHQAELIKIPSPENSFWELIGSYKYFYELDLDHFDLVISGKYPAWMVQHKNHYCYMLHRLRGFYDTYHFMNLPLLYESAHEGVIGLQQYMQNSFAQVSALPTFFKHLEMLKNDQTVPSNLFDFPGIFCRQVVHYLDSIGLSKTSIKKFYAISQTVAARKDYFPQKVSVQVIYPPSNLAGLYSGKANYLFTVSRLDGPKRIGLLIEAMRHVKSDVKLKIAGTGPDESRLKEMAKNDIRIEFLGFVNDSDVVDLYANAIAVPYLPYDEDYGLITIEAMMSGKPVLTVTDSGGPSEFVKDGVNGYCVEPDPLRIAEKIDLLCNDLINTKLMGEKAIDSVKTITWKNTVSQLLGDSQLTEIQLIKRKKLTVAVTFPVFPPRGGGQSRIYHLYRHLAKWWDIELITMTNPEDAPFEGEIAPGLTEIRIPKTEQHQLEEQELSKQVGWVPVTDVAMLRLYKSTPNYVTALAISCANADVVVASHPYMIQVINEIAPSKPLWYEAHNVEIDLKKSILGNSLVAKQLLDETALAEKLCWCKAEVVYTCSEDDLKRLRQLYGNNDAQLLVVPNGVSLEDVFFIDISSRLALKKKMGFDNVKIALFMGSWHEPNLEAIEHIIKFAEQLPKIYFLILGSGGLAFQGRDLPSNLGILGVVDDETKSLVLSVADVALNPMMSGSGTNLKMLDYFAAGLPVISTKFGARGLSCESGRELIYSELVNFPNEIDRLFRMDQNFLTHMIDCAKILALSRFDWSKIAAYFIEDINKTNFP